jgi:hypothetical protein
MPKVPRSLGFFQRFTKIDSPDTADPGRPCRTHPAGLGKNPGRHSEVRATFAKSFLRVLVGLFKAGSRTRYSPFEGVNLMQKKILTPSVIAMIIIAIVAMVMTKNILTVSAQQILDRAYAAQMATTPTQGIQHIRTEVYTNIQAKTGDQAGSRTFVESYFDIQSGKVRLVTIDEASGQVWDLTAYDGTYFYYIQPELTSNSKMIVYRTPLTDMVTKQGSTQDPSESARQQFDQFRSDPNVKQVGKQSWTDGREVYLLQSQQPVKIQVDGQVQTPIGISTLTFDAQTYMLLESQTTLKKDGKDVVVMQDRYLVNEILPADSQVAWDLSDIKSIFIVDVPDVPVDQSNQNDLPPVEADQQELAKHGAYVMSAIPIGFDKEISDVHEQDAGQPFSYMVAYRNEADDYFEIQSASEPLDLLQHIYNDEVYTTTSGLELHFSPTDTAPNGKQVTRFMFTAPNGLIYLVNSTLPLDQIKQYAEDLLPAQ